MIYCHHCGGDHRDADCPDNRPDDWPVDGPDADRITDRATNKEQPS